MSQAANRLVLFPDSLVSLTARLAHITRFDRHAISSYTLSFKSLALASYSSIYVSSKHSRHALRFNLYIQAVHKF